MRIGIFGGTFDPIHIGHLRAALEIAEELELGKVYMVPSALPPHKTRTPTTLFFHRLEMVKLAVVTSDSLGYLDLEGKRSGPSYSIDTLRELYKIFGKKTEFFFIIGLDAFLEIKTWKEYENLFEYANFVVIGRSNHKKEDFVAFISGLQISVMGETDSNVFTLPSKKKMMFKKTTRMDISATSIRKKVGKGRSIDFLVPDSVNKYIREKELY
ncbi:nicotinate-nucleotide adenylyltransferase [Thermodesulfobacteriota bacterium]